MTEFFANILAPLLEAIYGGIRAVMTADTGVLSAYALAVIVTTIIFKLLLLPLTIKQMNSMKEMNKIQPELKKIQERYKNDKEKLNMETMKLYQEHKVNPMGGCLPLLIQFPIIIGFYRMLQQPAQYLFNDSSFVFEEINKSFFWVKDIGFSANHVFESGAYAGMTNGIVIMGYAIPVLAVIAAALTFVQSKTMNTGAQASGQAAQTQKMMTYMMPLMILMIGISLPAGLALYWVMSSLVTIVQNYFIYKPVRKSKGEI